MAHQVVVLGGMQIVQVIDMACGLILLSLGTLLLVLWSAQKRRHPRIGATIQGIVITLIVISTNSLAGVAQALVGGVVSNPQVGIGLGGALSGLIVLAGTALAETLKDQPEKQLKVGLSLFLTGALLIAVQILILANSPG